jgi:predicted AlkP superfamily pyrophosphatase or phosphodiesterase
MKSLRLLIFFALFPFLSWAQNPQTPKLVIGIVVDQMRYDYIYRYWNKFGENGFKRLVRQGYSFANTKYNYTPTYTGPGHASIYSGTTPSMHGIVSNDWYDRANHKYVYCVKDTSVQCVGGADTMGNMSPRNLMSKTIGDELKLATNFRGKVISIAMKDRSSILPGGHAADGAFWYDSKTGNWITSTWYMNVLPPWVNEMNNRNYSSAYRNSSWTTLLPINMYTESTADNNSYEEPYRGESAPVFPHDFSKLPLKDYEIIRRSPFGNTFTKNMAKAAVIAEGLGKDEFPDLLSVSFSSTDYIGHQFGTNSIEIEDCYLRLDKDLEDFLNFIDSTVGIKNTLIFLTADHGAVQNPGFLSDHKFNAGYYSEKEIGRICRQFLFEKYRDSLLFETIGNECIYLNDSLITSKGLDKDLIAGQLAALIRKMPDMKEACTADQLKNNAIPPGPLQKISAGYYPRRSGDIFYSPDPGFLESTYKKGTSHGTFYNYDLHIPLIFYGYKVNPGESLSPVFITDIAPTLASMLHIEFPDCASGNPLDIITTKK